MDDVPFDADESLVEEALVADEALDEAVALLVVGALFVAVVLFVG